MKWSEGKQLSIELKNMLEQSICTVGMKMFKCHVCDEDFGSTEESFRDGKCGMCELAESETEEDDEEYIAYLERERRGSHTHFGDDYMDNPNLTEEDKESH
jgi:hypothetical protein